MSKDLEALEDIILYLNASEPKGLYCENIETIKQALLELQSIKKAKPSEALECLKKIENEYSIDEAVFYKEDFNQIRKELKALEIIKEKNVSVWGFRNKVFGYKKNENGNIIINDTYKYYLYNFGYYHNGLYSELLTEEEFNLLKEVLE